MTSTKNNSNSGGGSGNTSSSSNGDGNSNGAGGGSSSVGSSMNSIEAEYSKINEGIGWQKLYQEIREKCDREANEKHFGTGESEKPHNRVLNRYRDVNPYDHSRIIIHRGKVDYINANLVKLERADRKYILTQGPLGDTVGHFWLMVWEQETKAILMLNKLMEKKQVKCHMYWPERKGPENALKLDEVKLTVEYLRCEEYRNYCCRWFKLTDLESNQSREIIQFHYTTWPDFGIPSSPVAFLQFLKQVRDSGALDPDVGPAVVHCSAGIGRSGTFCLVDCCLVLIEKEGENNVSVKDVLYELRRYRMGLIQTSDQLYFSYQAIIEGIKLLKDPAFLDYKETPFIPNEEERREQLILDETPPPLPPRIHSLPPLVGTLNRPLPNVPLGASLNEKTIAADNTTHTSIYAPNNFNDNEHMSNRPLPPLPLQKQQKVQIILNNSDSDDSDDYDIGIDDDDNVNDVESASEEDDENANNESSNGKGLPPPHESTPNSVANELSRETAEAPKSNGIESGAVGLSVLGTNENELKRRKRAERQHILEQKVNEIKRKHREAEDGNQSAKKRRSLVTYIAAGVMVGVICVYAYSKMA